MSVNPTTDPTAIDTGVNTAKPHANPEGYDDTPDNDPGNQIGVPVFKTPHGFIDPKLKLVDRGQIAGPPPSTHPNTLVALVTSRIVNMELSIAIRDNPALATAIEEPQSRFAPVLDALASLAVSDAKSQVVAMAATIKGKDITLTVSENTEVKPALRSYIQNLLARLVEISKAGEDKRPGLQLDFYKTTYSHSIQKLLKRFTKHSWLEDFESAFAGEAHDDAWNCKYVISALLTLKWALKDMRPGGKNQVTDNQLEKIMIMISGVIPCVDYLHNMPTLCVDWADAVKSTIPHHPTPAPFYCDSLTPVIESASVEKKKDNGTVEHRPVPLLRAIEKLMSHNRHVLRLFDYAASPEGSTDLVLMTVECRPVGTSIEVDVPRMESVKDIIRPYLPVGVVLEDEIIAIKTNMWSQIHINPNIDKTQHLKAIVHCECGLIAYLNEQKHLQGQRPLTYIGVSKLSCAACYAWIRAFNATHTNEYHTQGSHGRWYANWAMPPAPMNMGEEQKEVAVALQLKMNKYVGEAYKKFIDPRMQSQTIALSDSTVVKADLPPPQLTMMQKYQLNTMCCQLAQLRKDEMVKQTTKIV